MRKKFFWKIQPDQEHFEKLWEEAIFVFDTNILLDMYRAKKSTFNDIKKVLNKISDSIWLPYNVGDEYLNNRESTIQSEHSSFEDAIKCLEEWGEERVNFKRLKGKLDQVGRLIPKEIEELYTQQEQYFQEVQNVVQSFKEQIDQIEDDHLPDNEEKDEILEYLLTLFDGKVGEPLTSDDLDAVKKEGKERYENEIPPGYKDKGKEDNEYGDLIIWKQILNFAKEKDTSIILVSSDRKEDWWKIDKGVIKSPHPLLRKEFHEETKNNFWMYTLEAFLGYAKEKFNIEISKKSIEESGELSDLSPFERSIQPYFDNIKAVKEFASYLRRNTYEFDQPKDSLEEAINNIINILLSLDIEELTTFYSELTTLSSTKLTFESNDIEHLAHNLDLFSNSKAKKLERNINIIRVSISDYSQKELIEFYVKVSKKLTTLSQSNKELILNIFGELFLRDDPLLKLYYKNLPR